MELSPKQQSVDQIKKAGHILILGPKKPDGDFLGSALAIQKVLRNLGKKADIVTAEKVPEIYSFLPFLPEILPAYESQEGKIIRIDTKKFPAKSLKWQKNDDSLDIILESEKNLKFEYIELLNGKPKPDLIIVLNCPDLDSIDKTYETATELFFEVPIINLDHHSGNDYFGTINLVDLTATSTAEILVSLFEALGIKIEDADVATCLLSGIITETQSFRTQNTTPKSLTVAAQLLAAGARQQEIIANLYKKRPIALLKLWGDMLAGLAEDKKHSFAWTKVSLSNFSDGITKEDVFDATDELLSNTPDADLIMVLVETEERRVFGKLKAVKGKDTLPLAKLFGGDGVATNSHFEVSGKELDETELFALKQIHDYWGSQSKDKNEGEVWDVLENKNSNLKNQNDNVKIKINKPKEAESIEGNKIESQKLEKNTSNLNADNDVIDHAIESIAQEQKTDTGFASIGEVIKKKRDYLSDDMDEKANSQQPIANSEKEIDVFDESEN